MRDGDCARKERKTVPVAALHLGDRAVERCMKFLCDSQQGRYR